VLTEHRYMTEDVHISLAFLVSVADWAGVSAPLATGLLAIGAAICGKDLRGGERTLEGMGLAALSRDAMTQLLEQGEAP
jgi:opine dehydrogenase